MPLPAGLDERQAMCIGTAGLTAMLCVLALEEAGVTPQSGEILVTGAAGGVGSTAVALLAALGYQVAALTYRPEEQGELLTALGASRIVPRSSCWSPPSRWRSSCGPGRSIPSAVRCWPSCWLR